jgi:L-2-hydroxyglutarate oxidase LhgO
MHEVGAIVCGAGVIGLAIAHALARSGHEVLLLEREARFGTQTSSRNSEVIHAGIYYPAGSLKAELCIAGRARLYSFCETYAVPHRRIGKLIVATTAAELDRLAATGARAAEAGVRLQPLDADQARRIEPALSCAGALLSEQTGIIDAHGYMQTLLGLAEDAGAQLVCRCAVSSVERCGSGWMVRLEGDPDPAVRAPVFVNAAGLGAQALAARTDGVRPEDIPPLHLARGAYCAYAGQVPFGRLIYPLPVPGGLGTHLTLDLAGRARFGPDVEWIDAIDYSVDPARTERFASAARAFWPAIDADRLTPAFAGIRPKIAGSGQPDADFMVQGPDEHGLEGLINLFGIESPGLTASLALAGHVQDRLFGTSTSKVLQAAQ